jgi:hypothetical protein
LPELFRFSFQTTLLPSGEGRRRAAIHHPTACHLFPLLGFPPPVGTRWIASRAKTASVLQASDTAQATYLHRRHGQATQPRQAASGARFGGDWPFRFHQNPNSDSSRILILPAVVVAERFLGQEHNMNLQAVWSYGPFCSPSPNSSLMPQLARLVAIFMIHFFRGHVATRCLHSREVYLFPWQGSPSGAKDVRTRTLIHSLVEGQRRSRGAVPMLSSASATRPQSPHPVIAVVEVALVVDSSPPPLESVALHSSPATSLRRRGGGGKKRVLICEVLQLRSSSCDSLRSVAILDLMPATTSDAKACYEPVTATFLQVFLPLCGVCIVLSNWSPSCGLANRVRSTGSNSRNPMEIAGGVANAISQPKLVSG